MGTGLADRFCDLELDCYWFSAPSDLDRTGPIRVLGGKLTALWDYDQDGEEWSEDYRLGELDVTVSNFLAGTIERFIDDVVLHADTDPVKHMRLAALQQSRPLLGAQMVASWRARAAVYPDKLVSALVAQALTPPVLRGWAAGKHLPAAAMIFRYKPSVIAPPRRAELCICGGGAQPSRSLGTQRLSRITRFAA